LKIEIDPWEWTQIDIFKHGHTEPGTLRLFGRILRPGDVYYDVGAHVGFHALVARSFVGPTGKVIAVDPQPYNCARILCNSELNDFHNISVVIAVVGNASGQITLHNQDTRDKSRLSMKLESMNDRPQMFRVPMMRLADLMDESGDQSVRLLKVDVEGYEPEVICGAGSGLRKIENIILEILPDCMGRVEITSMLNRLIENGFRLCDIYGAAWEQGASLPENNLLATRVDG